MSIKEKLMPFIEAQHLSFEEFSLLLGTSGDRLLKKIESGHLGVKDAYAICKILNLKAPADIFF